MYIERHEVSITTNADGDATGYTGVMSGRIYGIRYTKVDFADGVDFTMTLEKTGETVWTEQNVNASKSAYPAAQITKTDGTAAVTGTDPVLDRLVCCKDRLKIVVAAGGNVKSGTFHVLVG